MQKRRQAKWLKSAGSKAHAYNDFKSADRSVAVTALHHIMMRGTVARRIVTLGIAMFRIMMLGVVMLGSVEVLRDQRPAAALPHDLCVGHAVAPSDRPL